MYVCIIIIINSSELTDSVSTPGSTTLPTGICGWFVIVAVVTIGCCIIWLLLLVVVDDECCCTTGCGWLLSGFPFTCLYLLLMIKFVVSGHSKFYTLPHL